jgi:hypothetical protein
VSDAMDHPVGRARVVGKIEALQIITKVSRS